MHKFYTNNVVQVKNSSMVGLTFRYKLRNTNNELALKSMEN